MKKLLLLAITVLITLAGIGQEYKLDSVIYTMFMLNDSTWFTNNLDKYEYYPNGKQHWFKNSYWSNAEGKWVDASKKESIYDESGRLAAEILLNWDGSQSQWTNAMKSEYFYDENGNDTMFQNSNWSSSLNEWFGTQKYERTYDANGYMTSELLLSWNTESIQWDSGMFKEFYNNGTGKDTLHFVSFWEAGESGWNLMNKINTYYDENGNDTLECNYGNTTWRSDTATWVYFIKGINLFDENGRKIIESSYMWDDYLNDWTGGYMKGFTYDENGNAVLIDQYMWDYEKSEWFIGSKLNQYFSLQHVSNVKDNMKPIITMYPNPARDHIYFGISDFSRSWRVEIFNIQGKKVLEQKLTGNGEVSVINLTRGLYMYKLYNNGNKYSGKIMLE